MRSAALGLDDKQTSCYRCYLNRWAANLGKAFFLFFNLKCVKPLKTSRCVRAGGVEVGGGSIAKASAIAAR